MEFKEALDRLIECKEFKDWHKDNKEFFLTNFFVNEGGIQIGYCRKKDSKIVSFLVGDKIEKFEDEVFKRPDTKTKELKVDEIKVDIKDAMDIVDKDKEKNYPSEEVTKKIIILSNSDDGEIWNITFVTKSFNMINFKIDAKDGKLLSSEKRSLLQLGSEMK